MSTKAAVTWGIILKICEDRGIEVMRGKGSECKLKGQAAEGEMKLVMRVGHNCCRSNKSVVYIDYVKKFQRFYGITDDEIWG